MHAEQEIFLYFQRRPWYNFQKENAENPYKFQARCGKKEAGMAVRAYYGEELYFNDGAVSLTQTLQENIRVLLSQNHGLCVAG